MKILIAYDGSESSMAALEDLTLAGLPREAEALVATASGAPLPDKPLEGGETSQPVHGSRRVKTALAGAYEHALKARGEAHNTALRGSDRVSSLFPGWRAAAEALPGDPVSELLERAEGWGADLLVAGSRGRGALRRIVGGASVSTELAKEARCSVRVARRAGRKAESGLKLIVGVDGSQGARAAVAAVANRAWPPDTRIRLVTSVKPFGQYGPSPDAQLATAETILNDAARLLAGAGLSPETAVLKGEAAGVLTREAKEWGAACVFVGSGNKRGFERYMLGSVSSQLVRKAHCTVEVVRARG